MTPAARHQAAIEVLETIQSGQATEQALLRWSRGARYAGSKDRAAVRDIVFDVVRARHSCQSFGGGDDGRALVLGLLRMNDIDPATIFTGDGYGPDALSAEEMEQPADAAAQPDVPEFLIASLRDSLGDAFDSYCATLRNRAPVFLRVNTAKATLATAQESLQLDGVQTEAHPNVPTALRVTEGPRRVAQGAAFRDGLIELQDASSQAIVDSLPLAPGMRVLDYCAGGGGKALAMAAQIRGPVDAYDAFPQRMTDLPERSRRAEADIRIKTLPTGPYDLVLCDAPCSGSGTWRRAAEGKWSLTAEALSALFQTQKRILEQAAPLVAPDGTLAYATCSVLKEENEAIIAEFLAENAGWKCDDQHRFLPSDQGDGFFVALLTRN